MPTRSSLPAGMRLTQPWFEVRRSPIQGRGGFAVRTIPRGTRIIEYAGERIGHARVEALRAREKRGRHHTFLFLATRRTMVDARVFGNEAKFINHSCDPNCRAVRDKGRIYIEARRTIRKGQELAYDYAYSRDDIEKPSDEARYPCHCGAKKCRGTILKAKAPPFDSGVRAR